MNEKKCEKKCEGFECKNTVIRENIELCNTCLLKVILLLTKQK